MLSTSMSLLQRLRDNGDGDAWRRFVDLYWPLVRNRLRGHLPQAADVDDLAQQVFAVVVEKFPAFAHAGRGGAFRAWLRGIAVNRLRMYWRSHPGANRGDPEPILQQTTTPLVRSGWTMAGPPSLAAMAEDRALRPRPLRPPPGGMAR